MRVLEPIVVIVTFLVLMPATVVAFLWMLDQLADAARDRRRRRTP